MTTREQAADYRRDVEALLVLLVAELARQWTAAGLPILPGIGRARESQTARRARRGLQEATAGGVVLAGAAAAATRPSSTTGTGAAGAAAGLSVVGTAAGTASTSASARTATSSTSAAIAAGAALSSTDVVTATQALLDTVPGVLGDFQSASASLGADFFDGVRSDAGIRGRYLATPVDARDDARQEILVRWATQPLRPENMPTDADLLLADDDVAVPDLDAALQRLIGGAYRQVLEPGRASIEQASDRDPAGARWAREARPGSCAFCAMLATRALLDGAVYHSAELAGGRLNEGAEPLPGSSHYHDDCTCIAVPSWEDAPYEPPEHVEAWAKAYFQARDDTGSGDTKTILAAMRGLLGSH